MACFRGAYTPHHPAFAPGSAAAAAAAETAPVAPGAPDVAYAPADEAAIEEYTRKFGASALLTVTVGF